MEETATRAEGHGDDISGLGEGKGKGEKTPGKFIRTSGPAPFR